MYWNCVRERFFHGLPKDMRTNLRTQFDSGASYYQMLELARIVESENLHENSGTEIKNTSSKGKSKVNVASVDNPTQQMQQMQQLQGAVKGLTKLIQDNHNNHNSLKLHSLYHKQIIGLHRKMYIPYHRLLMVKGLLLLKEEEVVEVATGVEVVEVEVD